MTEEEKKKSKEAAAVDTELMHDWEDIGGIGNNMTPEQLEHIATTMFGCPEK